MPMSELKPCPCGNEPVNLEIIGDCGDKYMTVSGGCCGDWELEFRANHLPPSDPKVIAAAHERWNEAARATGGTHE